MSSNRHLVRAAVYVIMARGDRVLFIRRHNTGYRDGEYTLPAGHVEPGETFMETCMREAAEEAKVVIAPDDLELVHVMQRHEAGVEVVDYYFVARCWKGEPAIGEPHKADDLRWFTIRDAADKAIPFISTALRNVTAHKLYDHDGIGS